MTAGSMDLTADETTIVRDVLRRVVGGARVWVYGSRACGSAKPYSDLDLAVDAGDALSIAVLAELREAFDESDLRFRVDVTDLHACDPAFLTAIRGQLVEFPLG